MGRSPETDTKLDERVTAALEERFATDAGFVVVPTRVRRDGLWYSESDLETFKFARSEGLDVELLTDAPPEVLHEYSAGWYEEFIVAVTSGVTTAAIIGLVNIVRRKAALAVERGLHPGPEAAVPFKATLIRVDVDDTGTHAQAVVLEGEVADVVRRLEDGSISHVLAPRTSSDSAAAPGDPSAAPTEVIPVEPADQGGDAERDVVRRSDEKGPSGDGGSGNSDG